MTILEEIAAVKKIEVDKLRQTGILQERTDQPRGFRDALARAESTAVIAEIKKASPSRGIIRHEFNPTSLARAYQKGGATCLSVLTDEKYFKGTLGYLDAARSATALPVLRKDFIIDPLQIEESYHAGADAILLIVALLSVTRLNELLSIAQDFSLDSIVEVHDTNELLKALECNANMIGINNRNLHDFSVDLAHTEKIASQIPENIICISESGIFTTDDIKRVAAAGANAVLVGESLMRQEDVAHALQILRGYKA